MRDSWFDREDYYELYGKGHDVEGNGEHVTQTPGEHSHRVTPMPRKVDCGGVILPLWAAARTFL
jgi:hypothetical protein